MRQYAIQHGVPDEDIVLDYAALLHPPAAAPMTPAIGPVTSLVEKITDSLKPSATPMLVLLAYHSALSYDQAAARQFGCTKVELERTGQRLSDIDLQIASIALVQGVPLITHNRRHFERIADLAIEDWLG